MYVDILKLRNIIVSLWNLNINNQKTDIFFQDQIKIFGIKYNILMRNYLVFIGNFQEDISTYYIKLYLRHMYVAFINFNGDYFDTMKHILLNNNANVNKKFDFFLLINSYFLKGTERKTIKLGISLNENDNNSLYNGHSQQIHFTKNDIFQLKIYETYFIKHITLHFDRVFNILIKNEEMFLSYIKFKNMYIVDLSTNEILMDLLACRVC